MTDWGESEEPYHISILERMGISPSNLLHMLAEGANFAHISTSTGGLAELIKSVDSVYFRYEECDPGRVPDVMLFTFDPQYPERIPDVKLYRVSGQYLQIAGQTQVPLDLVQETPVSVGRDALRIMNGYVANIVAQYNARRP